MQWAQHGILNANFRTALIIPGAAAWWCYKVPGRPEYARVMTCASLAPWLEVVGQSYNMIMSTLSAVWTCFAISSVERSMPMASIAIQDIQGSIHEPVQTSWRSLSSIRMSPWLLKSSKMSIDLAMAKNGLQPSAQSTISTHTWN